MNTDPDLTSRDDPPALRRDPRRPGRGLRRLAQYAMLAVTLLAPLLFGGGPVWVQVGLSAAALLAALAWVVSRKGEITPIPFAGVAALALAATLFQLFPLPAAVVGLLSPEALALRIETGSAGGFLPLTLDVPATVLAAVKGFACLAILIVAASTIQSRGRSATFAIAVVLLGSGIALLSIGQRMFGVEKIYGFYAVADMPGSGFFGSFINGNHAASMFALAAILAIGCARETEGPLKLALMLGGVVCAVALLSTGSRAGALSAAVGVLIVAAFWLARRFGQARGLAAGVGLLLVGLPAAVLLALGMRGPVQTESLTMPLSEQKIRGWRDALSLIVDYPWTGVGRGAFEAPAAAYRAGQEGVRLAFPENILVQVLSEWGIPVAMALIAIFLVAAVEVARRLSRWEPIFQAAACGVLAVIAHDLADFGLEVPGVAFPTALALGLVAGRLQASRTGGSRKEKTSVPRWLAVPALGTWAIVVLAGTWAARHNMEADGARVAGLVRARAPEARDELTSAIARHPADYYFELLAADLGQSSGSKTVLRSLNRAQRLLPQSPIPHLYTGHALAKAGHLSQAAVEYRLAAERGAPLPHEELVGLVGFRHLAAAVPRQPVALIEVGRFLASVQRLQEADVVTQLAVELSAGSEQTRMQRVQIAATTTDKSFLHRSASELARTAASLRALELAAEALASAGDKSGARSLLRRAIQNHPSDGPLLIRSARLLFQQGDLADARALLTGPSIASFHITERVQAEELIAEIAAKEGHTELAEAARARARILSRMVQRQSL